MNSSSIITSSLIKRLASVTSLPDRLNLLQSISRARLEESAPPTEDTFDYLNEAIEIAEDLHRPLLIAEGFEMLGDFHARREEPQAALKAWGKASRIYKDADTVEERIDLALKSADISRHLGSFAETTDFFREAGRLAEQTGDRERWKRAEKELGNLYASIGDHSRALSHFLTLFRLVEASAPSEESGLVLNDIGITYAELGETKRALTNLRQALEHFKAVGAPSLEVMTLVNLSNIHAAGNRIEDALDCGLRALAIYDALNDRNGLATTMLNLSNISEQNDDLQSAADYRLRAFDIFEELDHKRGQATALLGLGILYHQTGKENDARYILEQALLPAGEIEDMQIICRCHEALADILEVIGDPAQGIRHLRRYIELQRELEGNERRKAAAEIQARFDLERSESEREILRLRAEQLEAETRRDRAELNALSLQLVEKQKFIEGLLEKFRRIEEEAGEEVRPVAQDMIRAIRGGLSSGINWQSFQQQFERANPDLLKRIAVRWPRLTQKQLQFCALTVTGLSTGEIAELLSVTTRSVETTRHRIRKEMGIDPKVELGTFLQGL